MSSSSHSSLNSWKNRSRTDIIVAIIDLAQKGMAKAEIMESAHLNSRQFDRYLAELTRRNLVEADKVKGRKVYITTQRGRQYLKQYSMLRKFRMDAVDQDS